MKIKKRAVRVTVSLNIKVTKLFKVFFLQTLLKVALLTLVDISKSVTITPVLKVI